MGTYLLIRVWSTFNFSYTSVPQGTCCWESCGRGRRAALVEANGGSNGEDQVHSVCTLPRVCTSIYQ